MSEVLTAPTIMAFLLEGGIISALIVFLLNRLGRKLDQREANRIEESYICMTMLKAIGKLSEATAIAQQEGRTNGEMTSARAYYTDTHTKLEEFITRGSAERTHAR